MVFLTKISKSISEKIWRGKCLVEKNLGFELLPTEKSISCHKPPKRDRREAILANLAPKMEALAP